VAPPAQQAPVPAAAAPVAAPRAGGVLGADGRLLAAYDSGAFRAEPMPGNPACLVVFRQAGRAPDPIEGALLSVGGTCPGNVLRGTLTSLEEFGRGIVVLPGRGRCQLTYPSRLSPSVSPGRCDPPGAAVQPAAAATPEPVLGGPPPLVSMPAPAFTGSQRTTMVCNNRFQLGNQPMTVVQMNAPNSSVTCRVNFTYSGRGQIESNVAVQPRNGLLEVQEVDGGAVYLYSPHGGYQGRDSFTIKLGGMAYGPGGPSIRFEVTVRAP
jgi:hypothetical protein